jgi:hypothetical protein
VNDSWFKSKLIRFIVGYWIVVIILVYSLEWVGRHEVAIGMAVMIIGSAIALWIGLRLIAWWRNRSYW